MAARKKGYKGKARRSSSWSIPSSITDPMPNKSVLASYLNRIKKLWWLYDDDEVEDVDLFASIPEVTRLPPLPRRPPPPNRGPRGPPPPGASHFGHRGPPPPPPPDNGGPPPSGDLSPLTLSVTPRDMPFQPPPPPPSQSLLLTTEDVMEDIDNDDIMPDTDPNLVNITGGPSLERPFQFEPPNKRKPKKPLPPIPPTRGGVGKGKQRRKEKEEVVVEEKPAFVFSKQQQKQRRKPIRGIGRVDVTNPFSYPRYKPFKAPRRRGPTYGPENRPANWKSSSSPTTSFPRQLPRKPKQPLTAASSLPADLQEREIEGYERSLQEENDYNAKMAQEHDAFNALVSSIAEGPKYPPLSHKSIKQRGKRSNVKQKMWHSKRRENKLYHLEKWRNAPAVERSLAPPPDVQLSNTRPKTRFGTGRYNKRQSIKSRTDLPDSTIALIENF